MGTDCKIKSSNYEEGLDRWYVFSDSFKNNTWYSKKDALKLLDKEIDNIDFKIKNLWGEDRYLERRNYYLYWLNVAKRFIYNNNSENIKFLNDQTEQYYE